MESSALTANIIRVISKSLWKSSSCSFVTLEFSAKSLFLETFSASLIFEYLDVLIPSLDIDMVFLVNPKQVIAYMINKPDLHMYDCFLGHDNKMIFVFRKADTYELYKKWCAHELPVVSGGK